MADVDVADLRFGAECARAARFVQFRTKSRHWRPLNSRCRTVAGTVGRVGRTVAERDRQLADVRLELLEPLDEYAACPRAGWRRRRPPARPRQSGGWPTAPSAPGRRCRPCFPETRGGPCGSRPEVGSSRINSSGLWAIASDSETLARMPFESSLILRSRRQLEVFDQLVVVPLIAERIKAGDEPAGLLDRHPVVEGRLIGHVADAAADFQPLPRLSRPRT